MAEIRKFDNAPIEHGAGERIAYKVDTTKWPGTGSVTGIECTLTDKNGEDRGSDSLSGSASADGDEITTQVVENLDIELSPYKLEVAWEKSGNTLKAWGPLEVT